MSGGREYVKIASDVWHILTEEDQWKTVCGLVVRFHPNEGEHQIFAKQDFFFLHDKSCENCLRLDAHYAAAVWAKQKENDELP